MPISLRFLITCSLIFALSAAAFADTIRLKDGSRIKGKITGFSGGKFTVVIGEGSRRREMSFSAAEIESIQFDRDEPSRESQEVINRQASTKPVAIEPEDTDDEPVVIDETANRKADPVPAQKRPVPASIRTKPIELGVKVLADNTANGWTNSGWVVKKGQRIRITGSGEVSLGSGKKTGPSGLYDVEDGTKLLKSVPTGALIAVIGDDNNEFIYIGSNREFTATRDGALFLGLNEGNLNDNTGSFDVKIEISTGGGE